MSATDDYDVVKRDQLYDKVWKTILDMTKDAARGSITPSTFARVAVDVVLTELLKEHAIIPAYRNNWEQK